MEYGFTNITGGTPGGDVEALIDAKINTYDASIEKKYDDMKIYPTFADFPPVSEVPASGRDTVYLDNSTGVEYRIINNVYEPTSEPLSREEIGDLFR